MRFITGQSIIKGAASLLLCFWGYGSVLICQECSAHALPFIAAHLQVSTDQPGELRLSLAVDFANNPLITDETQARSALESALMVHHDGKTSLIHQLAPLSYAKSQSPQGALPDSVLPNDEDQPHEWMIAKWAWKTESPTVSFSVVKGNFNDVLLWRKEQTGEVKSMLLLAGDVSSTIQIPKRSALTSIFPVGCLLLLVACLVIKAQLSSCLTRQ